MSMGRKVWIDERLEKEIFLINFLVNHYHSNKDSNEISNSTENTGDYLFKQQNSSRSMKCQDFQVRQLWSDWF